MSDASYQAVGRVHRIGQTKETNVWHLVAADTAEEGLHARLRARTAQHAAAAAVGPVLIDDGPVTRPLSETRTPGSSRFAAVSLESISGPQSWALCR